MDGVSLGSMNALYSLGNEAVSSEVGVKVLKEALDQAASTVLPLIEGVGQNLDLTA